MLVVQKIVHIARGRFDRRHPIGPASWPFFDLLWVHRGTVQLQAVETRSSITLVAPAGVLIAPQTMFSGKCTTANASASICHFEASGAIPIPLFRSGGHDSFLTQAMVTLALRYHDEAVDGSAQERLLQSVLDSLFVASNRLSEISKARTAWDMAVRDLSHIRTLADVAALLQMSESRFRAIHREAYATSAGQHLLAMRMRIAAELLTTTGDTISEISRAVGYAHPESLTQAFAKFHDLSPRAYRSRARCFA